MASLEMQDAIEEFLIRLGRRPGPTAASRRHAGRTLASPAAADQATHVRSFTIGELAAEWIWATGVTDERVAICLHPGGYIAGSAAGIRSFAARLSSAAGCTCLAIDYRLAPEYPFPAAVDDALRTYSWLLERGYRPAQLALGGGSAGGGLALAALVAARDAGLPMPSAGFALSPWTDLTLTLPSICAEQSPDPLADRAEMQSMAETYLAGADPRHPWASPLYADLAGLPPLHLEVGAEERLADDSRAFADAAARVGVRIQLHETPGAMHCFPIHLPHVPESAAAIRRVGKHLVRAFGGGLPTAVGVSDNNAMSQQREFR